ncbi:MAG: class I adenylate-forming enzyme family protein [Propionicimonas sp.]
MLDGDDLWDASVTRGLTRVESHGRVVSCFADAPATLYASLAATAERLPAGIALVSDDGVQITFGGLLGLVDQFAALIEEQLSPGDRIALLLDTSIEFAVALYAANRCGAVVVPVPTKHREPEIEAILRQADPALVVAERRFESLACLRGGPATWWVEDRAGGYGLRSLPVSRYPSQRPAVVAPEADCILMYTSGTTARSKGVLLTNRNVCHAIVAYQRVLGLDERDSSIVPVPIYHITGVVALLGLFVQIGGRLFLQRRFDADRVLRTTRDQGVSFLHASPTVFAMLLAEAERYPSLPRLRLLACGAGHMPVSRIQALHRWLPTMSFRTVYGLTETSSPGTVFPGDAATSIHCGSSGRPIPGLRVSIRDEAGVEVPDGERGTIWLSGTNLLRGYDRLLPENLSAEGWLNTQDVGYLNDDGYLFVVDRTKDMINRGGEKVWCIDVEEELRRLPGVVDAAVVGVPHQVYGEEPAALIVPDDGAVLDPESLRDQLRQRLASYQLPRHILLRPALPLTPGLKVDKAAVRALFTQPVPGQPPPG